MDLSWIILSLPLEMSEIEGNFISPTNWQSEVEANPCLGP